MSTMSKQSALNQALARKAEELITIEFIECRICPLLGPGFIGSASNCRTRIVRNNGTGRLTIRYMFDSDVVVFAKLYDDDLGCHSYEVNQALWYYGFNKTGRYRVPQPLGFFAEHALLLMLGVHGTPLGAAFDGDSSVDLVSGSQEAAQWLSALHHSTLRVGSPERDLALLKRCWAPDLVMKAVTVQPGKADMVRELVEILEQSTTKLPGDCSLVFTHGRYHHDHVFLSSESTNVIDLDRCRPSHPAKDVAEFIRLMRLTAFNNGFAMKNVELATSKFLSCYLARLPQAAESLGCYLAAFTFHSLLRGLRQRSNKDNKSWKQLEDFHVREIQRALSIGP
jgi:Phosphotransferase enzyme family